MNPESINKSQASSNKSIGKGKLTNRLIDQGLLTKGMIDELRREWEQKSSADDKE